MNLHTFATILNVVVGMLFLLAGDFAFASLNLGMALILLLQEGAPHN